MSERPLMIALDFSSSEEAEQFLAKLPSEQLFLKVGMELFYSAGTEFVEKLKEDGHHVFLDLKLHDIPNTVKKAMSALAKLEIDVVNVHAAGGQKMMEAALEGLDKGTPSGKSCPKLIAVTQLTSTTEQVMNEQLRIPGSVAETVVHYADLAKRSGLDGVVSSPLEVPLIRKQCGEDFLTVTPGIRLRGDDVADQSRVTTPFDAHQLGSWAIVVGRSITNATDPLEAYHIVKQQWEGNER